MVEIDVVQVSAPYDHADKGFDHRAANIAWHLQHYYGGCRRYRSTGSCARPALQVGVWAGSRSPSPARRDSLLPGRASPPRHHGCVGFRRTMYPPEVGQRVEDSILEQLASQARETLAQLKADGVVGDDVVLEVATANGWDEAIDAAD